MPGIKPVNVADTAVVVVPLSGEGVAADVGGESSTTCWLPLSATNTSPDASSATLRGMPHPEPMVLIVPLGSTSLTARLPRSATNTSPAALTATPVGVLNPEPIVLMVPLGSTS